MIEDVSKLTPAMRQYHEFKARYADCILLFRMGDFYEMFFEDAIEAARVLEITLTSRSKDETPMCGVPHHAVSAYIHKLVATGHKVAICDQLEGPAQGQKVFRREVTQVITPGVIFDSEGLEARSSNYLLALSPGPKSLGLAYLEASTGEFRATEIVYPVINGELRLTPLLDELSRINPREILYSEARTPWIKGLQERFPTTFYSVQAEDRFQGRTALQALARMFPDFQARELFAQKQHALEAAGAVAGYLLDTLLGSKGDTKLSHMQHPKLYGHGEHLILDECALLHLEITRTMVDKSRRGSLLGTLDQTSTSMGGRLLQRWVTAPLTNPAAIAARQDAIDELYASPSQRSLFVDLLSGVYDLERLNGKIATNVAGPRDLMALRATLEKVPELATKVQESKSHVLQRLAAALSEPVLAAIHQLLATAIVDDPPATLKDGGAFRSGYSTELDELSTLSQDGKGYIAQIEAREQKRTGINSLKVRYNRVFGYYIEITRAHLDKIPEDYERRQTLTNAERFVTPELKEYEAKVLTADERRIALEQELFSALRARLAETSPILSAAASALAELDCYVSLADIAHRYNYVRPVVGEGSQLEIRDGRHPVVERLVSAGSFVSNDLSMDPSNAQLLLITGPNMAGKSTVMRQVALICLMAQIGSFVPAREAKIPIFDRIFTRVGAADNLARGASTFMVEMQETKNILEHATPRSLIVLDEIGRGTSTFDGLSIAWSVAEHIHDRIGALTLFATHYHELTDLAQSKPRVRNFHVAIREWEDQIIFLHKLLQGGANRSYGIHVAQLAGLPDAVIVRAREILKNLESFDLDVDGQPGGRARRTNVRRPQLDSRQMTLFGEKPAPSPVLEELAQLSPDAMTPIEALTKLARLKAMLDKEKA